MWVNISCTTELTGFDPGTSFPLSLWTHRSTLASSASSTKQYPAEPLHKRTEPLAIFSVERERGGKKKTQTDQA